MKLFVLFLGMFLLLSKDSNLVESKVYSFLKAKVEKMDGGEKRELIQGETTHLKEFQITAITIHPGINQRKMRVKKDQEAILFVKEGAVKMNLNDSGKIMPAGSVALMMPGEEYDLENAGNSDVTYYLIKYKSKQPVDLFRGKNAGGSMLLDWESIKFKAHDKGGIRRYFDRKSAMSERIEMHVTTLNPAIKSHEPHTHAPAEIIVMMQGTTEMEIGNGIYAGQPGDIYFLGSTIPHAIRNIGEKPCMYLAFQWE